MAPALVACTRGEGNPGAKNPQCRAWKQIARLARSHTMVQTPIGGRAGIIDGATHFTQAHEVCERASSRGHALGADTGGARVKIHRGRAAQREDSSDECFPKTCLTRLLTGFSATKNFAFGWALTWERSWLVGSSTNPMQTMRMSMQCNARQHHRFNQKPKQESDNERKPFNRQAANPSPPASHQSTLRDKKSGNDETKQNVSKKKRLVCYRCGGKGHPARLCPSPDDCQDVDEVGTEPPSDADSDLFGFDWDDDLVASISSGTDRSDRTRCVKELLAFVDSGAVDSVLPKMGTQSTLCRERVTHQAVRAAGLSSHNERWEQHEHHLGSCRCAQATDFRQPLA